MNRLFTSESVTEGHPDKLCDRISDAVLDAMLEKDPLSRVACETFATTGLVVVGGEISTDCYVDIPKLVRDTICEVGYDRPDAGFDGNTCAVLTSIDSQSPDISMGVTGSMEVKTGRTKDKEALLGAGDQGMMFGYACDETADLMPLPITLANELAFQLSRARKSGAIPYILPDGKTQVTVEYGDDGKPLRVDTVVISTQHLPGVETVELSQLLVDHVIAPVWGYHANDGVSFAAHRLLVNPTGRFVKGGPAADTGLTGRKIIVDTYGGYARHGGGAFSGKDPTKVDRSAAYMARYIAKNVVAAGLANKCEVQLAYAIGVANPVSVMVDTFGTGYTKDSKLADAIRKVFDMRPKAIIDQFNLRRPIYKATSAYGHFGNATRIYGENLYERRPLVHRWRKMQWNTVCKYRRLRYFGFSLYSRSRALGW